MKMSLVLLLQAADGDGERRRSLTHREQSRRNDAVGENAEASLGHLYSCSFL